MFTIQLGHPKINSIISTEFASVKEVFPYLFHKNEERVFMFWNEIPIQLQYIDFYENFDEILAMNWYLNKETEGKTKATISNKTVKIEMHLYWENDHLTTEFFVEAFDEKYQSYADAINEKPGLSCSKDSFLNEWNTLLHQIITAFNTANISITDGTERRKLELLHQVEQSIKGYGKLYIRH